MTSKLIEALNKCETQKSYEGVTYTLIDDELRAYIEESLERLEVLEKENKELWENIEKYNHKFASVERKKADLIKENEKLKKAIEILIREKIKPSAFLGTLKNYKEVYGFDMPYEKACILLDCDITEEEFLLLKEVLGNE